VLLLLAAGVLGQLTANAATTHKELRNKWNFLGRFSWRKACILGYNR
jgi:hypothetical protein